MKVLVTGASGFVGRAVCSALRERHEVLAPPRAQLDLLDDSATASYLAREKPDAVVHSATTPGHRNAPPVDDLASRNLRMFHALCAHGGVWKKMILLGSGAEYDVTRMPSRAREDQLGQHVPRDPTGASKYTLSLLAARDPRITVLRPFGVYGPHEDWQIRLFSNAICKTICSKPITLRQDRLFDYVAVEDLARVVLHFLEQPAAHGSYNVTPDRSVSLKDAVMQLNELTGAKVEVRIAAPGLGLEYSGDNARLRAELPKLKLIDLADGLRALIAFWSRNRQQIDPALLDFDK